VNRIATIGFFDGVHKGHQFLFEHLRSEAAARGLEPLIITFESHPRATLESDYMPRLLTTLDERRALLQAYGEVVVLPFEEIQPLTAALFMAQLREEYNVTTLLMGYDHRFGSDRLKHPQDYRRVGQQCGIEVLTMNEYIDGEWHVSSTEIRSALEYGNIAMANELLGRPYSLSGEVVHGKALGRELGFPTANIVPSEPLKVLPKAGVYVVKVIGENLEVRGFCNIDTRGGIEVHMPNFKGDLYGQQLTIQFLQFLREEKQFTNLEELRQQIKADIDNSLRQ